MEIKKNISQTTLPYVNGLPHLGHCFEFVAADMYARVLKLRGFDVWLNTGTDEHGIKIQKAAKELGISEKEYVDKFSKEFLDILNVLNVDYTSFIRTTNEEHKKAAKAFWNLVKSKGDIYKKFHKGKYCTGCESFLNSREEEDGKCPIHLTTLEEVEEENYFFKLSKYSNDILNKTKDVVFPSIREREKANFIKMGIDDISISRPKSRVNWGIDVPEDDSEVMYVWFDALVNYISTLGWPNKSIDGYWPGVQFAGKDNLKYQSIIWQGMLLSASIKTTRKIYIHGMILDGSGVKMSKSLGNVLDIKDILNKYDPEVLRLILLKYIHPFEDTSLSLEIIDREYEAHLVKGLGNLVSRIMKLSSEHLNEIDFVKNEYDLPKTFVSLEDDFNFNNACNSVYEKISDLNKYIQEKKPFNTIKSNKFLGVRQIKHLVQKLDEISFLLWPIMPKTSEKNKEDNTRKQRTRASF